MSYKYLILGMLSENPMSGYDIKKVVKQALGGITSASYGTLYPTLHKLLEEGCVSMQEIPQRTRPSKKVYHITDRGREELREWLKQPASTDQVRREFLLKLYLAHNLEPKDVQIMLAMRRAETEQTVREVLADKARQTGEKSWLADYTLAMCEAELNWLTDFESRYKPL